MANPVSPASSSPSPDPRATPDSIQEHAIHREPIASPHLDPAKGILDATDGHANLPDATHRPGWRSRRNQSVQNGNAFCALCGIDSRRLHVHHIEGHRDVSFTSLTTVVTVCAKHRSSLESFTAKIAPLPPLKRRHAALVLLGILGDSLAVRRGSRLLKGVGA